MLQCEHKFDRLRQRLRQHKKLAVAFSGGVDSTLLLYAALESLGPQRVVALTVRSILNSQAAVSERNRVFKLNFSPDTVIQEIAVSPLSWPEFIVNDGDRCYHCKKRMYIYLQQAMEIYGCTALADGTNSDDRREFRPGLKAVEELQVVTPLSDVGLIKSEVRRLAQKLGLSNFDLPSNSCLATRIPQNISITEKTLRVIETAEQYLYDHGFIGCRVRVHPSHTTVEVQEKDFAAFVDKVNREQLQSCFLGLQLGPVVLSLKGR